MDDLPSTLSLDWQRSETPQPTPPFSVSEPLEERPEFDGYLLSPIEATALFRQHRMYPVQLASVFNEESASLFAAWLATSRGTFRPEELPWVPVGNVGPLLILGHVAPEISQPLLPWGTFQPVCLRREDYQRQLTSFANLIEEGLLLDETPSKRWTGGVGRFPATLVMPTERRSAIQFLSQYFLHRSEVWTDWRKTVTPAIAGEQDAALFPEYAAAVRFLTGENSVASITDLRLSEAAQKRLPETLRRRLSVVAERERNLWIGANTLPQADAEDRLYAELGEGWTVHWVLKTNSALPDGSSSSSGVVSGVTGVSKIVRSRRSYPGAQRELMEAEERQIVLEEKDWVRFDPRSRDAEPGSLWRWCLYQALQAGATDLHLEPGTNRAQVRHRIDGLLEVMVDVSRETGEAMVFSLMNQAGLGSDKYRPVDGSFTVRVLARERSRHLTVRVRANAYPVRGVTQKVALRFLPVQGDVPKLETVLPSGVFPYVARAISRPDGLILVCGPTGSGKTTTIFSCLTLLNRPEWNITTLENPVEYELEGANQGEINENRDVSWPELNKAFLRQDPDIGLIGEIRDEDTMKTILRTALTGHLVFGSLHTKSCPTAVTRMTDLGANINMLAESLLLILCQRLLRRVCSKCASEGPPSAEQKLLYERYHLTVPATVKTASAEGCEYCHGKGYWGRVAAVEVLPNVPAVRRMIENSASSQCYSDWMKAHALPTVFENALELAAKGTTTVEEALNLQDAWDGQRWEGLHQ